MYSETVQVNVTTSDTVTMSDILTALKELTTSLAYRKS